MVLFISNILARSVTPAVELKVIGVEEMRIIHRFIWRVWRTLHHGMECMRVVISENVKLNLVHAAY